MKAESGVLIALGILGAIFVLLYKLTAKPPHNIIGPKTITGFIICGSLIIIGIVLMLMRPRE